MMYVVTALHKTGHGNIDTAVMATANFELALKTMLEIEDLGYSFVNETGVKISRLEIDRPYPRGAFKLSGDVPPYDFPLVCARMKFNDRWNMHWYDHRLKCLHEHRAAA